MVNLHSFMHWFGNLLYNDYTIYCGPQYLQQPKSTIFIFLNYCDKIHSKWMKIGSNGCEVVVMDEFPHLFMNPHYIV